VTLIRAEHLVEIAMRAGLASVDPAVLRRNLVVSGLPLSVLIGQRLSIGDTQLELSGPCSPCSRMDEALGPGGRSAMSGRGGVTAIVIRGGEIRRGDTVESLRVASDTTVEGNRRVLKGN
jgi:MOSC domain-containing protein YiiM